MALKPRVRELFTAGRPVETTIMVAAYCEVPEAEARAWAHEHDVARIGRGFAWSEPDVIAFLEERIEADEEADETDEGDD